MKKIIFLIVCVSAAMCVSSCSEKTDDPSSQYSTIEGYGQGENYSVTYKAVEGCPSKENLKKGIDSIFAAVNNSISLFDPNSLICRHNKGEAIVPDAIFKANKTFADSLMAMSKSVINYKIYALFNLWETSLKNKTVPTQAQILAAEADTTKYDFNIIGQGYTADMIGKYLESYNITNYFIKNGGEVASNGVNQYGATWNFDLVVYTSETKGGKYTLGKISVPAGKVCGASTSGVFRHFAELGGVKYPHIIDVRTSAPVVHKIKSATIVAESSILADALSTYCLLLTEPEAKLLIENTPNVEGCLVNKGDSLWTSKGLVFEKL